TITNNSVKKSVQSYTLSKSYINTMLRATVINIIYHRLNIDEKEFLTKVFNNIPFKTFKSKSKNSVIRLFHTCMGACKDAIEKNYLRKFYMYFIDSNTGNILEHYEFSFKYTEKNLQPRAQTEAQLTESTSLLLQTLEDLRRHKKLTGDTEMKVEITYFDDTPDEYEPPGFRNLPEDESLLKIIKKQGNSVVLGSLFTGFHNLKCSAKGGIFNLDVSQSSINDDTELNVKEKNPQEICFNNDKTQDDLQMAVNLKLLTISDSEELEIDCPCKLPLGIGPWYPDIITCVSCKRRCHAPCQGYIDKTFLHEKFRCFYCRDDDDNESLTFQDAMLYKLTAKIEENL
ncbi:uncharacterized protein BDFB_010506, partial [Asbolus verrucosus]